MLGDYIYFIYFIFKIILFLAALGLHCCVWAFSSCGKRGLVSSCGVLARASVAVAMEL